MKIISTNLNAEITDVTEFKMIIFMPESMDNVVIVPDEDRLPQWVD